MKVFSTANVIGQAFKNVGRASEILRVLSAHGFAELLSRMKVSRFLPAKYSEDPKYAHLPAATRLRLSFEQLGPTFVKFGQLLATRADLLPASYIEEFQKLQDRVGSIPYSEIKRFLEKELGRNLEANFKEFETKPMAAASIAQVHAAVLQSGQPVAIKIQRPGIEKTIKNDISILRGMAILLERYVPEARLFNPLGMVEEFFQTIAWELDFRVEANNMKRIKSNLSSLKKIAIPKVYSSLSTGRVLVLEKFEGIRFSDREAILAQNSDPMKIVEYGCDAFFHMVMRDGLFHGDLHAGNLFVLKDGRIGIIDFGIVGRLSKRVKDSVITIFISMIDEDFETLASEYAYLSHATGKCDVNTLQKDLMDLISPYIGMSLGEVNIGHILLQSTEVAARNHLQVPRELMLLFKALVTIEGLGKSLEPNFDLLPVGTRLARETLASRYSRDQIVKDLVVIGRDLQNIAENVPRLLKRFLRRWSKNNFVLETRNEDIESLSHSVRTFTYFFTYSSVSLAISALGITLIGVQIKPLVGDVSIIGLVVFLLALFGQLYAIWSLRNYRK